MNYYPHHIGDFNNATRHLTRIERSIYRDLIDYYYDSEKPLPDNLEYICRCILADDEIQVYAVQQVLREYFILTDKGYENDRCNEIIKEYKRNAKNKSKAGKASAIARKSLKAKEKTESTGVEQVLNRESTGVRNQNQEPEPRTKVNQKKGVKRFTPPSVLEIQNYIYEKKYQVDAERFLNHYESNGWMVGKTKMKNWKAAVRNWHSRNKDQSNETNSRHVPKAKQFSDAIDRIVEADIEQNGFVDNVGGRDIQETTS